MKTLIAIDEILFEEAPSKNLLDLLIYLSEGLKDISIMSVSRKKFPIKTINYLIEGDDLSYCDNEGIKHTTASYDILEKTVGKIEKPYLKEFILQYKIARLISADYYVTNKKHLKSIVKRRKAGNKNIKVVTLIDALRKVRPLYNSDNLELYGINYADFGEQIKSHAPFYFSKNLNLVYQVDNKSYKELPLETGWGIRNILSFILETRDKIEVLFQEKPSEYHAIMDAVYYLNYFFILICSLFDNLAWFLVHYYEIPYEKEVDIKLNSYGKGNLIYDFLNKNEKYDVLNKFIVVEKNFVERFFPLRNLVTHRPRIPSILTHSDQSRLITYNMGTDTTLLNYFSGKDMADYFIEHSCSEDGNETSISPLKFIYAALDDLKIFLDSFFQNIYNSQYSGEYAVVYKEKTNKMSYMFANMEAV